MSCCINVSGKLLDLSAPRVMGILDVTGDMLRKESRKAAEAAAESRTRQIIAEGGSIIDVCACPSGPESLMAGEEEETGLMSMALGIIRRVAPHAVVSVCTSRSDVARMAVERYGADIINDRTGGERDSRMFSTAADLGVPYVLTNPGRGNSCSGEYPDTGNAVRDAAIYLSRRLEKLRQLGQKDVVIDPGFGIGQNAEETLRLLSTVSGFRQLDAPLLFSISGKQMVGGLLGSSGSFECIGALHAFCLTEGGANIMRVHDVAACSSIITLTEKIRKANA